MSANSRYHRTRFTRLHITINTNHAANTAAEEQHMLNILEHFFTHTLADLNNWRTLIRIQDEKGNADFALVDEVLVDAIGLEIGEKRHLVHAHATITIQHHGKVLWKNTQRKWQELFNRHARVLRGSYVNITLMNAKALNYASKHPRDNIVSYGMQPAVTF